MKKLVSVILALALVFALCATAFAAEAKPYVLGFSCAIGTDTYLKCIRSGIEAAVADWSEKLGTEVKVICTDAGANDPAQQISDLEDLQAQGVDGLLVWPGDPTVVKDGIKRLYNANNIPVIDLDIPMTDIEYQSYIVTEQRSAGVLGGEMMLKALEEAGKDFSQSKVVAVISNVANTSVVKRVEGFQDTVRDAGCVVLDMRAPQPKSSIDAAKQLTEDLLLTDPDISGIFTTNNVCAVGISMALKEQGRDDVTLIAFDGSKALYEIIKEGKWCYGSVVQQPYTYGYEGVNQLMYLFTGETDKIEKDIYIEPQIVTKYDVEEHADDPSFQN